MASRTSKFYKDNPEARDKRLKYQKKYNKQSMQIRKRVELNKINRQKGTYGNGDGKDVSHTKDGSTVMEDQSKNRARNRGKK
jgi:hypothetical protein